MAMNDESKLFGITVRALIALLLTLTVCSMCMLALNIQPTLHDAFFLVLGFFFGQKNNGTTITPTKGDQTDASAK